MRRGASWRVAGDLGERRNLIAPNEPCIPEPTVRWREKQQRNVKEVMEEKQIEMVEGWTGWTCCILSSLSFSSQQRCS